MHGQLVDAWGEVTGLTDDYAWRRVAWHLKEAGRAPELRGLLLNFNWLEAKLEATNPNALMAAFRRYRWTLQKCTRYFGKRLL